MLCRPPRRRPCSATRLIATPITLEKSLSGWAAVEVRANQALRGFDIRLCTSPGVAVSGRIQYPQVDVPKPGTKTALDMRLEADHPSMDFLAFANSSNRFEFPSVPPGRYVLSTWINEVDERRRSPVFD